MKLIVINPDGQRPSGVGTYVLTLARDRDAVVVLSLDDDRAVGARVEQVDERTFVLGPQAAHRPVEVARALARIAASTGETDIVLLPNVGEPAYLGSAMVAAELKENAGVRARIIGTGHSDHINQYQMLRRYADHCAAFFAVSTVIADRLKTTIPDRAGDITAIPYPLQVDDCRRVRADPAAPLELIYVGRLEEESKRVSRLASVARHLVQRGVTCGLTVVGGGPHEQDLRQAMAPMDGTSVSVRFVSSQPQDQVRKMLAERDVFLLVSAYEGQPLALLEAMAAGLCPVAMATESGVRDLVREGETGYVVPQGDTAAMAEAILGLDRDRARIGSAGSAARQFVGERFGVERHVARLIEISTAALTAPAPPRPRRQTMQTVSPTIDALMSGVPPNPGRLVIFGRGIIGRTLLDACLERGWTVAGMADSDPSRVGRPQAGVPVCLPRGIPDLAPDRILVGSVHYWGEIVEQVRDLLERAGMPDVPIHTAGVQP